MYYKFPRKLNSFSNFKALSAAVTKIKLGNIIWYLIQFANLSGTN